MGIEQSQLKERFAAELLDQTKQFEMRQADLEEEIQILLRTRHKTNKKETGDYDQEEYADEDNLEELEYEDDDCEESTPGGSVMEKAQGMRSGRKGGGGHVGFDTASSLNDTRYAPKAVASRGGVKAKGAGLRLQIPSHVAKSNATKKSSISSGDIQPLAEANTSPMAKKYTPSPKKRTSIVDETSNKKAYKKVEYVSTLSFLRYFI